MSKRTAKGSKAVTATNGHTRVQTPVKADIAIDQGRGLAALAAQLADLEELFMLTCDGQCGAEKVVKVGASGFYTPEQIEASSAASTFDDVNRRAHALTDTIQDLLLQMEPRTLDETLSLALVYRQQITIYLSDLYDNPEAIKDDEMCDRQRKLDRAAEAIIRGLVHGAGATSPLLKRYACDEGDLVTWDGWRRTVTKLAQRYPDKPQACANREEVPR